MAGIPKYVREDMEECVIHGSGNRRESKPGERTQGIRRDIETLDTRIHSEHRRVQSMMKDLTALWDPLLELKKESS